MLVKITNHIIRTFSQPIILSKDQQANYKLTKKFRSSTSLEQICKVLQQSDIQVKQYCKTNFLECLLEYPFVMADRKRPQCNTIFNFVGELNNLNNYQNLLRIKFYEKSKVWDLGQKEVEKKIAQLYRKLEIKVLIDKQEFDFVDASNWLILNRLRSNCKITQLSFQMTQDLKKKNYQFFKDSMFRMLSRMFKRLYRSEWKELRKHKFFFEYLTHEFSVTSTSVIFSSNNLMNMYEGVSSMQLNRLGYGKVPLLISEIISIQEKKINSENNNISYVQKVFKNMAFLPNNFMEKNLNNFYRRIKDFAINNEIYLCDLPIKDMTFVQIQNLMGTMSHKNYNIMRSVFYCNRFQRKYLFRGKFLQTIEKQFFKPLERQIIQESFAIQCYSCIGKVLLEFYHNDNKKKLQIVNKVRQSIIYLKQKTIQSEMMQITSLTTLFHLLFFKDEMKIQAYEFNVKKHLLFFIQKKQRCATVNDTLRYDQQVQQTIEIYINSCNPKIQRELSQIINNYFTSPEHKSTKNTKHIFYPHLLFTINKSQQYEVYSQFVYKILDQMEQDQIVAYAEQFVLYFDKSSRLVEMFLHQIWEKGCSFEAMAKVFGVCQKQLMCGINGELLPIIKVMLEGFTDTLQKPIQSLTIYEYTSIIINYCTNYPNQTPQFTHKFITHSISQVLSTSNHEPQSLKEYLYALINYCYFDKDQNVHSKINELIELYNTQKTNNQFIYKMFRLEMVSLSRDKVGWKQQEFKDFYGLIISNMRKIGNYQLFQHYISLVKIYALGKIEFNSQDFKLIQYEIMAHIFRNFSSSQLETMKKEKNDLSYIQNFKQVHPLQLIKILGYRYPEFLTPQKYAKRKPLINFMKASMKHSFRKQSFNYYYFLLSMANNLKDLKFFSFLSPQLNNIQLNEAYQLLQLTSIMKMHSKDGDKVFLSNIWKCFAKNWMKIKDEDCFSIYYFLEKSGFDGIQELVGRGVMERWENYLKQLITQFNGLQVELKIIKMQQLSIEILIYFWITIKSYTLQSSQLSILVFFFQKFDIIYQMLEGVPNFQTRGMKCETFILIGITLIKNITKLMKNDDRFQQLRYLQNVENNISNNKNAASSFKELSEYQNNLSSSISSILRRKLKKIKIENSEVMDFYLKDYVNKHPHLEIELNLTGKKGVNIPFAVKINNNKKNNDNPEIVGIFPCGVDKKSPCFYPIGKRKFYEACYSACMGIKVVAISEDSRDFHKYFS